MRACSVQGYLAATSATAVQLLTALHLSWWPAPLLLQLLCCVSYMLHKHTSCFCRHAAAAAAVAPVCLN
jgi:hypothetical protein